MRSRIRWILPVLAVTAVAAAAATSAASSTRADASTATPIKHLVVIFQENVSFDHYFGTYPNAANTAGRAGISCAPGDPIGQRTAGSAADENPNSSQPVRLDSGPNGPGSNGNGQLTCDQNHGYTDEQKAFDMAGDGQVRPASARTSGAARRPTRTAPGP